MRLNKYIALCGIASRRAADKMISEGHVSVNGRPATELGMQINPDQDRVKIDGKVIQPAQKHVYIILNKPKGYITTRDDERGRKTVFDLVRVRSRIFPVGRLDAGSEGLLLFTNNGELANRLMHPRFKVAKKYRVKVDAPFSPDHFMHLSAGIELDDGLTAPAKASYYTDDPQRIEITIREGKNRQVRRMFEALGYKVKSLKRVQYGPLSLDDLPRGKWRHLKRIEVEDLLIATNLVQRDKSKRRKY